MAADRGADREANSSVMALLNSPSVDDISSDLPTAEF